MPVPNAYTETGFAEYLNAVLGDLSTVLGWDAGAPQVQEALTDALIEYGDSAIANISGLTNLRRLRALGRRAVWRSVLQATAGHYDISGPDATFSRSKIQAMAKEALALAESECLEWDPRYAATVVRIKRTQDPYSVLPDDERVP